jgi:hypothetical protein
VKKQEPPSPVYVKSITRTINRTLLPFTANFNPSQQHYHNFFFDFIQQDVLEKFEIKEQNIVLNYSKTTLEKTWFLAAAAAMAIMAVAASRFECYFVLLSLRKAVEKNHKMVAKVVKNNANSKVSEFFTTDGISEVVGDYIL